MAVLTAKQQYWPEQLKLADSLDETISQYADAVIVGSALVKIIERNGENKDELLQK